MDRNHTSVTMGRVTIIGRPSPEFLRAVATLLHIEPDEILTELGHATPALAPAELPVIGSTDDPRRPSRREILAGSRQDEGPGRPPHPNRTAA